VDWSNEPYVRLYTRDSTNWKRIGWNGQCVLMALLRKVDRSGALDLEGLEPWEAVKLHVDCPEDVAKEGVAALLRVETLVIRGGLLVFPNHIAAQEATKSDRLRQKESRERRARGESIRNTHRDSTSQNVTPESQDVTPGHARSRPVTPGHSWLCCTLPSSAERTRNARASGQAAGPPPEPDEPSSSAADTKRPSQVVRLAFERRFFDATGNRPSWGPKAVDACQRIGAWLDDGVRDGPEFDAKLRRLLDGFFADEWARNATYPIGDLAERTVRYFAPPKPVRDVRKGFVDPAPASAFTNPTDLDSLFGPEQPAAVRKS
jgi:hypothetical protein